METVLASSNLVLFFSLPFKPVGTFNPFFNGHIALALDSTVYHIVNPYLLKTDFLFSVMPVASWLFGRGGKWVDRDLQSPSYTHVYLYRKSESTRTVVYGAGLTVAPSVREHIRDRFAAENTLFKNGVRSYHFLHANCSSIIAEVLAEVGMVDRSTLNKLPAIFFRRFVRKQRGNIILGSVAAFDRVRFTPHCLCYGLWGFNPRRSMDRWMASMKR